MKVASAFFAANGTSFASSPATQSTADGASAPRLGMSRDASVRPASASMLLCVVLLLVGTAGYRVLERWSLLDCVYAAMGVLTTVGIVVLPTNHASRLFTAVLNALSLGAACVFLAEVSDARRAHARRLLRLTPGGGGAPSLPQELAVLGFLCAVPLVVATLYFAMAEGWSARDAAFVAFASATGLGLADRAPATPAGKIGMCVYLVCNMGTTLNFCAAVGHGLLMAAAQPAAQLEAALYGKRASASAGASNED